MFVAIMLNLKHATPAESYLLMPLKDTWKRQSGGSGIEPMNLSDLNSPTIQLVSLVGLRRSPMFVAILFGTQTRDSRGVVPFNAIKGFVEKTIRR